MRGSCKKGDNKLMIEKQLVKRAYVCALEQKLTKAKNSYEIAKRDTIEAEGRMITRYDSMKTETAWLADGFLKEVKEIEQYISNIEKEREFANVSDFVELDLLEKGEYQGTFRYKLSRYGKEKIPERMFNEVIGCFREDSVIIEENKRQMEYRIKTIEKNPDNQVVSLDSIVTIEDDYGESMYYITNYLGGIELEIEGKEIFCISKQTPIARQLLGRGQGENIIIPVNGEMECIIKNFE